MPVYEYQCTACQKEFEYQQRMSDSDKTTCEACGGALERLISRTAFALKGSGWYKDLYASSKPAEAKTESSGDAAATPAKDTAPAKAEPASTPAATPSGGTTPDTKGGGSSTSAAAAAKAS